MHVLPSYLRRRRGDAVDSSKKNKKTKVIKQWDRDVLCLPQERVMELSVFLEGNTVLILPIVG